MLKIEWTQVCLKILNIKHTYIFSKNEVELFEGEFFFFHILMKSISEKAMVLKKESIA